MSIAPLGGANNAYLMNAALQAKPSNNAGTPPAKEHPQSSEQLPDKPAAEADKPETSPVKSFGYGVLGMDKPNEVKTSEDPAYTAGQVLKAIGTVGSIIAIMV